MQRLMAYTLRVLNKRLEARALALSIDGLAGAALAVAGQQAGLDGRVGLTAAPDEVMTLQAFVRMPRAQARESQDVRFILRDADGRVLAERVAPFKGPPQ